MEKKTPTVLLLEDDLAEYNNWKKWINFTQIKTNLIYVSDIESAIDEIKKNQIDIYIIDLHISQGNILNFLNLIKTKRGLKIALTKSVDNLEYLEKLYELGAIPISNNQNLNEPMRVAELIFSLYDLGLDDDYDEFSSLSEDIKSEIITGVNSQLDTVAAQVTTLKLRFEDLVSEVATMKIYLLGDYQAVGLKAKVEMIEEDLADLKGAKSDTIKQLLDAYNTSPLYMRFIILIFLGIFIVTIPLVLVHKITGS